MPVLGPGLGWVAVLAWCWLVVEAVRQEASQGLVLDSQVSENGRSEALLLRTAFQELGLGVRTEHHCRWRDAVECYKGRVVALNLDARNLQRPLPVEVGALTHLEALTLADNPELSGHLSIVANLTNLRILDLSQTNVDGNLEDLRLLTQAECLYLENSRIEGDLRPLQHMTNMKDLRLSNAQVEGNLEPLGALGKMRILSLAGNSQIKGDLQPLAAMTHLAKISLQMTQVHGTLEPLRALRKAETLALDGTQVNGSLEPLGVLTKLKLLSLSGCHITGDLQPLVAMTRIQALRLDKTKVHGDLQPLSALTKISTLKLDSTPVDGDLEPLRALKNMRFLSLPNVTIGGSLQPLAGMADMRSLQLVNTLVHGSLHPLGGMTQMKELALDNSHIKGDLRPLENLSEIRHLRLDNLQINGNLEPLRALTKISVLGLCDTQVNGSLEPLGALTQITTLYLPNSQIAGNLQPLATMSKMMDLRLSDTQVNGSLAPLAGLTQIFILDLRNTHVAGNLQPLARMTQLESLWLDKTKVNGDLEPLADLRKMRNLSLANSQISGDLQPLAAMTEIRFLRLENTNVHGHLGPLGGLTKVRFLSLASSRIHGDIQPLAGMTEMSVLRFFNTRVWGKLEALRNMVHMSSLFLEHSDVEGELQSLQAMRKLRNLHLSKTAVSGDIDLLLRFPDLEQAFLDGTFVTGRLGPGWRGHLRRLQSLKLEGSRARFLPSRGDIDVLLDLSTKPDAALLPVLVQLDVSECPLNGDVLPLLLPLATCKYLARLTARHSNLTGNLPDLAQMDIGIDGIFTSASTGPLANSLTVLDLAGNGITSVADLYAQVVFSFASSSVLDVAYGLLRKAIQLGTHLDLTDVALADTREASELLAEQVLKSTDQLVFVDDKAGFSCYDLQDSALKVTPSKFLSESLCGCQPGWHGRSIHCHPCGKDHYNQEFNQSHCRRCPVGSTTNLSFSTTLQGCQCQVGRIYGNACMCEPRMALHGNQCVECSELNLECSGPGNLATSAPPAAGHARLFLGAPNGIQCLDPAEERCKLSSNSSELGCALGYEPPLCMTCSDGYRSQGRRCKQCEQGYEAARWPSALALALAGAAAAGFFAYRRSRAEETPEPEAPSLRTALQRLLLAQGLVLLQFYQLWGVLVALNKQSAGPDSAQTWDQEYVRWLQLTAAGLRDAFSLECTYGRSARTLSALAGPTVPLLLLVPCALLEVVWRGQGVSMALKILSMVFIGGASSCAGLLRCQEEGGGGEALLEYKFRALLTHIKCEDATWVDGIGWTCAIGYGIFIPACLLFLIMKQHRSLAPSRRMAHSSRRDGDKTTLRVFPWQANAATGEDVGSERLSAVAVAYCAVFFRGPVRFNYVDSDLVVQCDCSHSANDKIELDANSLLFMAMDDQTDANLQRWHALTRMLKERTTLEQAAESDRVLAGAQDLFFKYAKCQDVWVEVALKLVAVALVAVAATFRSVTLTLGFTLGTAIALGTLKPYRQRQVNDLQSFCFFCLSGAAVGFSFEQLWLTRCALAAPLAVAGAQTLQPDCLEDMALRLFQAANKQWPALMEGNVVELNVEMLSFV